MKALQAKDLRIGNLLQDRDGHLCKVYELNENEFKAAVIIGAITKLPVTPIELTEDWLKKLGLKKDEEHPSLDFEFIYRDKHSQFIITKNKDGYWSYHMDTLYEGIIDLGKEPPVHRIQNIHHSLTGEELELK